MISALLIGRKGSVGFPRKNTYPVMGKPLAFYPMKAALDSKEVDKVFLSTDCEELSSLAANLKLELIKRPAYLATKKAKGEDAFVHGYRQIVRREGPQELIVLLFCNSATVNADLIDDGIRLLRKKPDVDSIVSVSKYNMWSPVRARKIDKDNLLRPFVPIDVFGDPKKLNCDRDSQGDVYFADMSVSVVRPHCLENIEKGLLPQKWMGQKIYPLVQEAGCDVDYEFQIGQTEYWLKKHYKKNIDDKKVKTNEFNH